MYTKRLLINITSSIVSFLVSMGINFVLTPYIVETVGKEAYGFVGLANNFVSYAQLITLALNALAIRFITIKIHEEDMEGANRYFTSVVLANIFISTALVIPATMIIIWINQLIKVPIEILKDVQMLWVLVFLNFLISTVTSTFSIATFATNRLDLSSLRSIESNFLRVGILLGLFIIFEPHIWYLGIASLICTLFIFVTDMHYKKKFLSGLKVKVKYFDFKIVRELVKSGIWSVITKLGQILSDGLDLLITNIFIDPAAMGVLAIAKTVPTAVMGLIMTVSNVFSPQLTIHYAQNNTKALVEELKRSMKISGFFTNIALGTLIGLGMTFYTLWVPGENIGLIQILSIITLCAHLVGGVINSLFGIFNITNKLKVNSYVILGMGILNTTIVFILLETTSLGILAVAGVSAITGIIKNLTFTPIYVAKCLSIPKDSFYPLITRYIVASLMIIGVAYGIGSTISQYSWVNLIIGGIFCSLAGIVINYFLLFNKNERNRGIKKVKEIIRKQHV